MVASTTVYPFPFNLSVNLHGELREVLEHLAHLVAALSAAHVDDDVRVRVLGQGLRDHGLAATERPRNGCGSTLQPTGKVMYIDNQL